MIQPYLSHRYEIKYLVSAERLPAIEASLRGMLTLDPNAQSGNGYFPHSIYFDSPDYRFYREKREGELVRMKPRIRSYRPGPDAPATVFFLELKGRYDRAVIKRRVPIDRDRAQRLLDNGASDLGDAAASSSVLAEFQYLAARFRLEPRVTVLYHRTPYYGTFYPNVRVTFDRLLQCSPATTLEAPSDDFAFALPANHLVVELKYDNKIPRLLLERIHALGMEQRTFSKYVAGIERCFEAAPIGSLLA